MKLKIYGYWYVFCNSALQALPLNIDPIPEKVIQEFGLANLYDVSIFVYFLVFSFLRHMYLVICG